MSIKRKLRLVLAVLNQYGIKLVLGQIPRLVYGNDAGLLNNIKPRRELKKIQKNLQNQTMESDPRGKMLNQQGYLLVNANYNSELIGAIESKYEKLIQDEQTSKFIGPRIREAIRGLIDPIKTIPELRFLLTDEVQKLIKSYYKANFKVVHVRAWRNYHVDAAGSQRDVYSNLWHNDPHPVTLLRYFVYLTDNVNVNTGALRLHSIANTKKIIRKGYLRRRAIVGSAAKMIEDPNHLIVFEGNRGSSCLVNPQLCLHRAGVPAPGKNRDMIQFTLAPSQEGLSENWYQDLPSDLEGVNY